MPRKAAKTSRATPRKVTRKRKVPQKVNVPPGTLSPYTIALLEECRSQLRFTVEAMNSSREEMEREFVERERENIESMRKFIADIIRMGGFDDEAARKFLSPSLHHLIAPPES